MINYMKNCYNEEITFNLGHFNQSKPIPYSINDHWLMPAKFVNGQWYLQLTKDHERVFLHSSLPSELKWRYVFIQSFGLPFKKDEHLLGEIELFNPPPNFDVLDIGWRASVSWYTFIVKEDFIIELLQATNFFKNLSFK